MRAAWGSACCRAGEARLLEKDDVAGSKPFFQKIAAHPDLVNHPDRSVARLNLGVCAARSGDLAEAAGIFEGLVEDVPDYRRGWFALGDARLQTSEHDKAADAYERGAGDFSTVDGDQADHVHNLGFCRYSAGDGLRAVYTSLEFRRQFGGGPTETKSRGDAAADTRIFRGDESRGDAAARIVRGDDERTRLERRGQRGRLRRGRDADIPRRRVAATRIFRRPKRRRRAKARARTNRSGAPQVASTARATRSAGSSKRNRTRSPRNER